MDNRWRESEMWKNGNICWVLHKIVFSFSLSIFFPFRHCYWWQIVYPRVRDIPSSCVGAYTCPLTEIIALHCVQSFGNNNCEYLLNVYFQPFFLHVPDKTRSDVATKPWLHVRLRISYLRIRSQLVLFVEWRMVSNQWICSHKLRRELLNRVGTKSCFIK